MRRTQVILGSGSDRTDLFKAGEVLGEVVMTYDSGGLNHDGGRDSAAILLGQGLKLRGRPAIVKTLEVTHTPIFYCFQPTVIGVRELCELYQLLPTLRVLPLCMRNRETLPGYDLRSLVMQPDGGPIRHVILRLSERVKIIEVITSLVLGVYRGSVQTFATDIGVTARALQIRAREAHLPNPHELLRWSWALWAIWRLTQRNQSVKHASIEGRFNNASAMNAAVSPVLQQSAGNYARSHSVDQLVDSFVERLERDL